MSNIAAARVKEAGVVIHTKYGFTNVYDVYADIATRDEAGMKMVVRAVEAFDDSSLGRIDRESRYVTSEGLPLTPPAVGG